VSVSGNDQVRPFIVIRLLYLQNLTITRGNADNADRFGGSGGALKLYKKGSTTALEAKVTYDATAKKAVLDPSINLQRGATCKAIITTGIRDLAGNALDQFPSVAGNQQKVWYFTIKP
jgi:hypothetical protein